MNRVVVRAKERATVVVELTPEEAADVEARWQAWPGPRPVVDRVAVLEATLAAAKTDRDQIRGRLTALEARPAAAGVTRT